jgi:hypothetical protein
MTSGKKAPARALMEELTVKVDDAAALLGLSRHGAYNAIRRVRSRAFESAGASACRLLHCARCSASRTRRSPELPPEKAASPEADDAAPEARATVSAGELRCPDATRRERPDQAATYVLVLRGEPGAVGVHGLRSLLKTLLRRHHFRCVDIRKGAP